MRWNHTGLREGIFHRLKSVRPPHKSTDAWKFCFYSNSPYDGSSCLLLRRTSSVNITPVFTWNKILVYQRWLEALIKWYVYVCFWKRRKGPGLSWKLGSNSTAHPEHRGLDIWPEPDASNSPARKSSRIKLYRKRVMSFWAHRDVSSSLCDI